MSISNSCMLITELLKELTLEKFIIYKSVPGSSACWEIEVRKLALFAHVMLVKIMKKKPVK